MCLVSGGQARFILVGWLIMGCSIMGCSYERKRDGIIRARFLCTSCIGSVILLMGEGGVFLKLGAGLFVWFNTGNV